jgi:hypothetical protein
VATAKVKPAKKTGRKPRSKAKSKAKAKPKRRQRGPSITAVTYNKLWASYVRSQNISLAAKEAGCSPTTATHFITGRAHPESGMMPIRERWLRVQARAQEEEELDLLTFKRQERKNAMNQLRALHGEMQLAMAEVKRKLTEFHKSGGKKIPKREMQLKDLVTSYDKAVRLVEHLLGGPDLTVGGMLVSDPLTTLTEAEALEYATTGRLPGVVAQVIDAEFEAKDVPPEEDSVAPAESG